MKLEQRVPALGDFDAVEVVEVLVSVGEVVAAESPLVTLETDKATMDVPATAAGTVLEVHVARGDKVAEGALLVTLDSADKGSAKPEAEAAAQPASVAAEPAVSAGLPAADRRARLVVLGGGPGGYAAAFRAADLGRDVILVERRPRLGGVCLNVGCIPSKALLHAARVMDEARSMSAHGIVFDPPRIELDRLRGWKDGIIERLTTGLGGLARQRKVTVLHGNGRFVAPDRLEVTADDGRVTVVGFEQCIVAAGSEPVRLPGWPDDPRIMDSTGALELADIPGRLLVVGGGIIGLEMACVYEALGSRVTVVELGPALMPGCDRDLVKPLEKRIRARYAQILTSTRVEGVEVREHALEVRFSGEGAPATAEFDKVLVAVGRVPNGRLLGLEAAGLAPDERGFIRVDRQLRTSAHRIFAIGDIVGQPMLAHKATHEGKVAAEAAAGLKSFFDARVIPSVAYTDPEVAWVGLTETAAREQGIEVGKGVFPWAASGRSLAIGRDEGFTKLLFDPATHRVLGGGIVGTNAGDLIGEVALAIEMGADAADIGLTIHPHPTLGETVGMAAEAFEGTLTDLYLPRKKA
ncbi:MAG: dihydrolipoyl dehydrogenase [Steroidobacteraceae bacterium]